MHAGRLRRMSRQQGFGLLDVIFALALLGLIYAGAIKFLLNQKEAHAAEHYRVRIEQVIEALQKYQYQQHTLSPPVALIDEFPTELNDLMTEEEQFWINCTAADEAAHHCVRPDSVPWTSTRLGYEAGYKNIPIGSGTRDIAYATLTFPLSSSVIAPNFRAKWATELLKLPYAKAQTNGDITVHVYDPLLSQLYDEFLQRDGSVALTDDWDVGGESAITNAQNVFVQTADGTQMNLAAGVIATFTAKHGDLIEKPQCPEGLEPAISTSIKSLSYPEGDEYKATGAMKTRATETSGSSQWQVQLNYFAQSQSAEEWAEYHDGEIEIKLSCVTQE